ncbi:hypothetical protein [Streptomyces violaceusniger]|uniref:Uncharacterized protein n=1 Tax=Streptomyces violaceusniger (strain Tu 4113) TaxID=653045 RepID=G2PHR8_STRV4|nr:hypothetical protein [Streptomyces violaceusniger]AEM88869.1 hypothetical protein Strvi_0093 [Streptomyces violaceusniger Tu 4113]
MSRQRPRALIETDNESGDVRVTVRGRDLAGPAPRMTLDGYTGSRHPDDPPLTDDQWDHLKRACQERSGTPVFGPAEVRGRALDSRESAALALAHHGYATMWRVRIEGDCAAWAIVPTESGRAALRDHLVAGSGDAAGQEPTA